MKGTKLINYGTPKYVQLMKKQARPHTGAKKPSGYCKKLKEPHRFRIAEITETHWLGTCHKTAYLVCVGCGKKDLESRDLSCDCQKGRTYFVYAR